MHTHNFKGTRDISTVPLVFFIVFFFDPFLYLRVFLFGNLTVKIRLVCISTHEDLSRVPHSWAPHVSYYHVFVVVVVVLTFCTLLFFFFNPTRHRIVSREARKRNSEIPGSYDPGAAAAEYVDTMQ